MRPTVSTPVIKLDKFLAQLDLDGYSRIVADQLRQAMTLTPMRVVLDKVEGDTVIEKARSVGVSRNTWYSWYRGEIRPNKIQAQRLQDLTGVLAEKFAGRR